MGRDRRAGVVVVLGGLLVIAAVTGPSTTPYALPQLRYFPPVKQNAGRPITMEGRQLGRMLFHDGILSADGSVSCASCHKQEFAFADTSRSSTGIDGTPTRRNTMPLFNLDWYDAYFWDGRAATLQEQILHPVREPHEMGTDWRSVADRISADPEYRRLFNSAYGSVPIDSTLVADAISQFLRTLLSYRSKFDRVLAFEEHLTEDEYAGFILMNDMTKGDCLHCHTTDADALGTIGGFSNNGLDPIDDPAAYDDAGLKQATGRMTDAGRFKIPSLRNIAITAPYMHDGRFRTLEEVLDFYSEGVHQSANVDPRMGTARRGGAHLSEKEKKQIIAFLHTLTDQHFTSDTSFSDPFR